VDSYGSAHGHVFGTVALWGEVIEHEEGFRGEFGKVNSIDQIVIDPARASKDRVAKFLAEFREKYGVTGRSHSQFRIG